MSPAEHAVREWTRKQHGRPAGPAEEPARAQTGERHGRPTGPTEDLARARTGERHGRPVGPAEDPARAWAGAVGGLLPDIPMLLIVVALKFSGVPDRIIFNEMYWQNWWQVTNAIGHNFWLWGGLLAASIYMRERLSATARSIENWTLVLVFAASGLLHAVVDFLCHREDAHMSLWPFTRWKFISPVSYYDNSHFGSYFTIFEALLGLALAIILFRRFRNIWVRGLLGLAMIPYVAVSAYFILN